MCSEARGARLEKTETRGKAQEVLIERSIFDPEVFKMKERVLMFMQRQLIETG